MNDAPHMLFLLTGAALFALGFRGVFAQAVRLRRIISVNVMGIGVFLVFVTLAARASEERPDPVPQAMVLTGIVVAVCATGLALVLLDRWRAMEAEEKMEDRP
jgi:multicomponent Na+:H+ antiporter subunit C